MNRGFEESEPPKPFQGRSSSRLSTPSSPSLNRGGFTNDYYFSPGLGGYGNPNSGNNPGSGGNPSRGSNFDSSFSGLDRSDPSPSFAPRSSEIPPVFFPDEKEQFFVQDESRSRFAGRSTHRTTSEIGWSGDEPPTAGLDEIGLVPQSYYSDEDKNLAFVEESAAGSDYWVTVYGFPIGYESKVLEFFESDGEILKVEPGVSTGEESPESYGSGRGDQGANWISILFADQIAAKRALSKNGKLIAPNIMIGVIQTNKTKIRVGDSTGLGKKSFENRRKIKEYRPVDDYQLNKTGPLLRIPSKQPSFWSYLIDYLFGW